MKRFKLFLLFVGLLSLFASGGACLASTPVPEVYSQNTVLVNSFELFWPIVAGKVIGEPLYFLKSLKESLRESLIFSSFKKAGNNITLSEKRTVEAEKLFLEVKDYTNAKKSLDAAQVKREKALDYINKAGIEGRYIVDLKNTLSSSLEKQTLLLKYVQTKVADEQKKDIEENIAKISSLFSSLK